MDLIPLLATLVNLIIFLLVIELIRRNRLKERYSLLWLVSTVVMLFFSMSRQALHFIARLFGIQYPPSFIFLLAIIFLIIILIHFSTVISELTDRNKTLAQDIALLKDAINGKTGERE
jgi:hypothetical protein